jgi:Ricin-type beta-trefoil lectin domain
MSQLAMRLSRVGIALAALFFLIFPLHASAQRVVDFDNYAQFVYQKTGKLVSPYEEKNTKPLVIAALEYLASHKDLMDVFGGDVRQGTNHFYKFGLKEKREIWFNACEYLASNPDLINAFGTDLEKAARHYISNGRNEPWRVRSFSSSNYMAANPDVMAFAGGDTEIACMHYLQHGRFDGHRLLSNLTMDNKIIGLGNKCIDAGGSQAYAGSSLVMWDCFEGSQHNWRFKLNGEIVGFGDRCITPNNFSLEDGTPLLMWECVGHASQAWLIGENGQIYNKYNPDRCIDISGASNANATPLMVYPCHYGSNQRWTVAKGTKLVSRNGSNRCFSSGRPDNIIDLWDCTAAPQRTWILRTDSKGWIKNGLDQCLGLNGYAIGVGVLLQAQTCAVGQAGQMWFAHSDGSLRLIAKPDMCANTYGSGTANGSVVVLWPCFNHPDEKWSFKQ